LVADDDADVDEVAAPGWGIWKKQPLSIEGETPQAREARARAVLEKNRGLIGFFLCKTKLPSNGVFTTEDLRAVFQAVLLQAHASYDPSRGAFSTWAHVWLNQAAMDVIRRVVGRTRSEQIAYLKALHERRWENDVAAGRATEAFSEPLTTRERHALELHANRRIVSLQDVQHKGAGANRDVAVEDTIGVEDPIEERLAEKQVREWLYAKLGNGVLTDRERTVMHGVLNGETFDAIGQRCHFSRQYAQILGARAIEKLKEAAKHDRMMPL
jgi:RNA polymerase sigma factor (sigma-70 family)